MILKLCCGKGLSWAKIGRWHTFLFDDFCMWRRSWWHQIKICQISKDKLCALQGGSSLAGSLLFTVGARARMLNSSWFIFYITAHSRCLVNLCCGRWGENWVCVWAILTSFRGPGVVCIRVQFSVSRAFVFLRLHRDQSFSLAMVTCIEMHSLDMRGSRLVGVACNRQAIFHNFCPFQFEIVFYYR